MAPDFEKFLKLEGGNSYSHTWGAIFWFCLPLGIVLSLLYHLVVRDPLLDNLPAFLKKRLARFKKLDWKVHLRKHYVIVLLSIVIGAVTHIVWDGFTHKNGPGQDQLSLLPENASLSILPVPLFFALNLLSSALGMLLVLYAIIKLPRENVSAAKENANRAYWPVVGIIMLAVVSIRFATGLNIREILNLEGDFWHLAITMVAAFFISLLVTPIILRLVSFSRR